MPLTLKRDVILAISNESLSAGICSFLNSNFPDLTITAVCSNSINAMEAIFPPDITPPRLIFVDDTILQENQNFIHKLEHIGAASDCIYVTEKPDFYMLQFALRCGVVDCFLYPLSFQAFSDALSRIYRIHFPGENRIPSESNEASRYLFWRNDIRRLNTTHLSMSQVNKEYGTRFAEGLFRALFIELNAPGREEEIIDNAELQEKILYVSSQILLTDCFDILYNRHTNGISILLNYSVGKRGHIARLIDQVFFGLRQELNLKGIEVTMAIGRVYSEFYKLAEAKQEILDARWAKRQMGSGRIINAEDINEKELLPEQKHQLDNLRMLIIHYFELLDLIRAKQYIDQFYNTFSNVLPVREMRTFSRFLLNFLFQTYNAEIAPYGNPENLRHSYIARESSAATIEDLQKVATDNILDLMEKIEMVVRRQYSQAIRDCMAFISSRHCGNIRLEELAALVRLSPQYLSSLFHKETGQTISAYIKDQKLKIAQNMLIHSVKNIAEIAEYIGFNDAHYFSKFFKAQMQITPSAYRKLKQGKFQ